MATVENAARHLTAQQLATAYQLVAAIRAFVDREAEHITLVGPFAHGRRHKPRHAVRARFEYWRVLRLAALYARVPLLQRQDGAP